MAFACGLQAGSCIDMEEQGRSNTCAFTSLSETLATAPFDSISTFDTLSLISDNSSAACFVVSYIAAGRTFPITNAISLAVLSERLMWGRDYMKPRPEFSNTMRSRPARGDAAGPLSKGCHTRNHKFTMFRFRDMHEGRRAFSDERYIQDNDGQV